MTSKFGLSVALCTCFIFLASLQAIATSAKTTTRKLDDHPRNEEQFIAAVRKAIESRRVKALMDLQYWEGTSKFEQNETRMTCEMIAGGKLKNIQMESFPKDKPREYTQPTPHGPTIYKYNLNPVRQLKISLTDKKAGLEIQIPVGVHDEKYYFAVGIPKENK